MIIIVPHCPPSIQVGLALQQPTACQCALIPHRRFGRQQPTSPSPAARNQRHDNCDARQSELPGHLGRGARRTGRRPENEPKAVEAVFDWSDLRIYDVNVPGLQHGVLLGTRRWPS